MRRLSIAPLLLACAAPAAAAPWSAPISFALEKNLISLNRPFVDANNLRPAPGTFAKSPTCGLAGVVAEPSELAPIGGLRIGGFGADGLETEFSRTQELTEFDGYLGGGFLRDYRVTIALRSEAMILER